MSAGCGFVCRDNKGMDASARDDNIVGVIEVIAEYR
jgi:hypothetical protein